MKSITKKALYKEYVVNKKSTRECANFFGTYQAKIRQLMKEYGIKARDYTENKMPLKKGDKMPQQWRKKIAKSMTNNPKNWMYGRTLKKHPNWKGGVRVYRRIKLSEVPLVCSICGKKNCNLEVHHIDFNRKNNKLTNLQVLCVSCHRKIHLGQKC